MPASGQFNRIASSASTAAAAAAHALQRQQPSATAALSPCFACIGYGNGIGASRVTATPTLPARTRTCCQRSIRL
jgi:hypothetical protein